MKTKPAAPGAPAPVTPSAGPVRRFHQLVETDSGPRFVRPLVPPTGQTRHVERTARSFRDTVELPDPPPRAWFESAPRWLVDAIAGGSFPGVKVELHGDDIGRAAGFLYTWDTCLHDGRGGCVQPIPSPTDHRRFYGDGSYTIEVVDDDGVTVGEITAGTIPIAGGHSNRGGAQDAARARQVLDQPDRQGLQGCIVETEHGAMFLGSVVPGLTIADARTINRSGTSNEWWPEMTVDADGRPVFAGMDSIGPVLVTREGYVKRGRNDFRVLAALGVEDDDPDAWRAAAGERLVEILGPGVEVEQARAVWAHGVYVGDPIPAPVFAAPGDDDAEVDVEVEEPQPPPPAPAPPVPSGPSADDIARMVSDAVAAAMAAHTPPAPDEGGAGVDVDLTRRLAAVETGMQELGGRFDDWAAALVRLTARVTDTDEITLADVVAEQQDRTGAVEQRLAELESQLSNRLAAAEAAAADADTVATTAAADRVDRASAATPGGLLSR